MSNSTYTVRDTEGRRHSLSAPAGLSDTEVLDIFTAQQMGTAPASPFRQLNTFGESVGRGIDVVQMGIGNVLEGAGRALEDRNFAKDSEVLDLLSDRIEEYGEALREDQLEELGLTQSGVVQLEDIRKAWEADDWLKTADLASSYYTQSLGEQAALFAGLGVATVAGSLLGGPAGGLAGGMGLYTALMYGENIDQQREAIERGILTELDDAKALKTAPFQAALGLVTDLFLTRGMMPSGVTKALGMRPGLAGKGNLFTRVIRHATTGALIEAPTEIGEEILSRWQAGMPLDDQDAMDSYLDIGIRAGLVGGTLKGTLGPLGDISTNAAAKASDKAGLKGTDHSDAVVGIKPAPTSVKEKKLGNLGPRSMRKEDLFGGGAAATAATTTTTPSPRLSAEGLGTTLEETPPSSLTPEGLGTPLGAAGPTIIDQQQQQQQADPEIIDQQQQQQQQQADPVIMGQREEARLNEVPLRNIFDPAVSDKKVAEYQNKGLKPGDVLRHGSRGAQEKLARDGTITPSQANQVLATKAEMETQRREFDPQIETRREIPRKKDTVPDSSGTLNTENVDRIDEAQERLSDEELAVIETQRAYDGAVDEYSAFVDPDTRVPGTELTPEFEAERVSLEREVAVRRNRLDIARNTHENTRKEISWRRASNLVAKSVATYNDTARSATALVGNIESGTASEQERQDYEVLRTQQLSEQRAASKALKDLITLSRAYQVPSERLRIRLKQMGLEQALIVDPDSFGLVTPRQAENIQYTQAPELRRTYGRLLPSVARDGRIEVYDSYQAALEEGVAPIPEEGLPPNTPGFYHESQGVFYMFADAVPEGSEVAAFFHVAGSAFVIEDVLLGRRAAAPSGEVFNKFIRDSEALDATQLNPVEDGAKIEQKNLVDAAANKSVSARTREAGSLEEALRASLNVGDKEAMDLLGVVQYLENTYQVLDPRTQVILGQITAALEASNVPVYVVGPNQQARDVLPDTALANRPEVLDKWNEVLKGEQLGVSVILDPSNQMILLRGTGFSDKIGSGIEPETIVHEAVHIATEAKILDATAFRGFDIYYGLFKALDDYVNASDQVAAARALRPQLDLLVSAGVITRTDKGRYSIPKNLPTLAQLEQDRANILGGSPTAGPRLEIWSQSNKYALKIFRALETTSNQRRAAITEVSLSELRSLTAVHEMQQVYRAVKRNAASKAYGLVSLDEFVAEGLSNPDFQKMIQDSLPKQRSKFRTALRTVFNLPERAGKKTVAPTWNQFLTAASTTLEGPAPRMVDIIAAAAEGDMDFSPEGRPAGETGKVFKQVYDSVKKSMANIGLGNLDLNADNVNSIVQGAWGRGFKPPAIHLFNSLRMFDKASEATTLDTAYFGGINRTTQSVAETARGLKDKAADILMSGKEGGWASYFWYAQFSLIGLANEIRPFSPTLANLLEALHRVTAKRNNLKTELQIEANKKISALVPLIANETDEQVNKMYRLIHDSSFKDENNDNKRHDLRVHFKNKEELTAEDRRVLKSSHYREFVQFSPELQQFYKGVIDFYEVYGNRYYAAVANTLYDSAVEKDRLQELQTILNDPMKPFAERQQAQAETTKLQQVVRSNNEKLQLAIGSKTGPLFSNKAGTLNRIVPYVPAVRNGDFWIKELYDPQIHKNRDKAFSVAEKTRGAAERRARTLIAQGKKLETTGDPKSPYVFKRGGIEFLGNESAAARGVLGELLKKMDTLGYGQTNIREQMESMFMATFPAESLMQQRQSRAEVPGADLDVLKNMERMSTKYASQIAMLETAKELNDTFGAISSAAGPRPSPRIATVVEIIDSKAKFLRDPNPNKLAAVLAYGGFFSYILFNISSAVVNLTQLPLMAFGLLGGEFGYRKASNMLVSAMRMYARGGRDDNTSLQFGGVRLNDWTLFAGKNMDQKSLTQRFGKDKNGKPNITVEEMRMLKEKSLELSAVRRTAPQEVQDALGNGIGGFSSWYSRFQLFGGWFFQNSERLNREVAMVASYMLSKDAYSNPKDGSAPATQNQLVNRAALSVEEINGPAIAEHGPGWMQDGWGKVLGTFKKYAWHMTIAQWTMARNALVSMEAVERNTDKNFGLPPGMPSPTHIARRQILGILVPAFALAGVHGLPYYGGASMIYTLLADDEDEEFDLFVRRNVGDIGFNGVLSHLTGASIMSRTGFYGHTPFERPLGGDYRASQIGPTAHLFETVMGPVYSATVGKADRALKIFDEGRPGAVRNGIMALLPTGFNNVNKAFNMAVEGVVDKRGVRLVETNAYDVAMQMFGFVPMDVASARQINNFVHQEYRRVNIVRSRLAQKLFAARLSGDRDTYRELMEEVNVFNRREDVRAFGLAWTPSGLSQSMRTRMRYVTERQAISESASIPIDRIRDIIRYYGLR